MSVLKTAMSSGDPDKTPVAKDVFTYCTKEKTDTWHVVMAHNSAGIVERVKCKACSSEHKYKRQNPLVVRASSSASGSSFVRKVGQTTLSAATKTSAASSVSLENTWLEGIKNWGEKAVIFYSPDHHFLVGDVLNHQVFGKGVVQSRRENKVDVLFKVGLKTLPSTSQTVQS